ncbi:HlyIII-domain-containing protein [Punctularia strigosozonata HHB-11173 SS5]|uniref:HlyIII-domain-containing protein n=1 Tax=Punctularia strigosozonata (strain HHB-11173) TaxID=741275 RepID=UPI000441683E|nr:HlyIII-domain-containing protein [Punctularia strigosozonata HHB-11173 SS5]EIN11606.1 HlyIII-domain-containing protein [Punctularia strigosozonata HHB-11173 SS5]
MPTTSSTTTTTTTAVEATRTVPMRRNRRRLSSYRSNPQRQMLCHTLPKSLDALDLSSSGVPRPTLASLRVHVLAYLADLETRLSLLESPQFSPASLGLGSGFDSYIESAESKVHEKVEEVRQWARAGLESIAKIRSDVCSYLPDFPDLEESMVNVKSRLPGVSPLGSLSLEEMRSRLPELPSVEDVRSRLPEIPQLPDIQLPELSMPQMPELEFDLSTLRPRLESLSSHIDSLQTHLSSAALYLPHLPHVYSLNMSIAPSTMLSDLLDKVLMSDHLYKMLPKEDEKEESMLEKAAREVAAAVKSSMHGAKLIRYSDLPNKWRNNPFVTRGYRFIPLDQWHRIIISLGQIHNETLNIHTHFLPFVFWLLPLLPFTPTIASQLPSSIASLLPSSLHSASMVPTTAADLDLPELIFVIFALLCLFASAVWHTMAGCAHPRGMEICARLDYVGIGWLISASVASVMYYAFQAHPAARDIYLGLSFFTAIAGTVLPFMDWFNQRQYKKYRIMFFLALGFTALAPLTHLSLLFSPYRTLVFIAPVLRSVSSYLAGLVFYATHFPECMLSKHPRWRWLDWLGGGSHAIWHAFIVLAIAQHRAAIAGLKSGI